MKLSLRRATDDDFYVWHGRPAPPCWFGLVGEGPGGLLVGIGGAYLGIDGRWWVAFEKLPGIGGAVTMQKAACEVIATMRAAGLGPLVALSDPAKPRADAWLTHNGFRPTDESMHGLEVWRWN